MIQGDGERSRETSDLCTVHSTETMPRALPSLAREKEHAPVPCAIPPCIVRLFMRVILVLSKVSRLYFP